MQNIEIICPCCDNILVINPETQAVVSHREHKKKESIEEFLAKEKNRSKELEDKFLAAKESEKHRLEEINKKFEEAKHNPNLKDPPPSIIWD